MILPPAQSTLSRLVNLVDRALAAGSTNSDWPYFQFVKGLIEYRQGNFSQAVEPLQSVISQGGVASRTVQAYCVLAMAQYRQGQKAAAGASIASGRELAEEKLEGFKAVDWNDRMIAQLLLREADALIASSNANPTSQAKAPSR
jgi:ABC-type amino acid transport substrate-binding protein